MEQRAQRARQAMLSGPSLDGASWHAWPPAAEEHASAKRVAGDDDDMALAKRPRPAGRAGGQRCVRRQRAHPR